MPIRAAAPRLPMDRDRGVVDILPPFGTNPPRRPLAIKPKAAVPELAPTAPQLAGRMVHGDPRELWFLAFTSKLTPRQVLMILRSALGGDVWQQAQLLLLMMESWPMLRKCVHEVCTAVSQVRYTVSPWVENLGDQPTAAAKDRAATVARSMRGMRPAPFTDEKGWTGMVYDLCYAIMNGLSLTELMWWQRKSGSGVELRPRASAWVHPRHYTFDNAGRLAVFDSDYNRLRMDAYGADAYQGGPDPNKFICSQFQSSSGSSLAAGFVRPLAWWWSAVVFNQEWMLTFAQKYSNPFLDCTYKPGTPDDELVKLEDFMAKAGQQGWVLHPEGTTLTVTAAQRLGGDNAQEALMDRADKGAQLLLLGQVGTSSPTPGKLGESGTQENVRREVLQGYANWMADTNLTNQLSPAICRVNYGDDEEAPTIAADFTEPTDPNSQAERDKIFLDCGVPMDAKEFYERNELRLPAAGDQVIVAGRIGKLAKIDVEVGGQQLELDTDAEPKLDKDGKPIKEPSKPGVEAGGLQGGEHAAAAGSADVQQTALNGAQVTALAALAQQVADGMLPLDSAKALAIAAFPLVPVDLIDQIFDPLDTFEPETPEPAPGFGDFGGGRAGGGSDFGGGNEDDLPEDKPKKKPAKAARSGEQLLRAALRRASSGDLANLREVLIKAEQAAKGGHVNGDFSEAIKRTAEVVNNARG